MGYDIEACRHCGHPLVKGAMRCTSCGKMLITAQQQLDSMKRIKTASEKSDLPRYIMIVITMLLLGAGYYFFDDQIIAIIKGVIAFVRGLVGY